MKETSDVTACVVDSGLFLPMALRLAEEYKRVLYWSPDMRSFPSVKQSVIGDGFPKIERVREFWSHHNEIDLWVFPDVGNSGLQAHLIEDGHPVWGSRDNDKWELDREGFMELLSEVGLDVPKFEVKSGWTDLVLYLRDKKDCYVKISRYRGDMETHHWRSWGEDEGWLYALAISLGPIKEQIRFLVFDAIETDLEIGGDTYCIDGQWPSLMLNGLEWKDKSYFAAVTKRKEMPEQLQEIMDAFTSVLSVHAMQSDHGGGGYRNQISFEDRVKGDKHFFIDATQRAGMPSSGSQQLLWTNFPEIVWAGANGEMVDPIPAAQFSIECMITTKSEQDVWDQVQLDPDLFPWARLSYCCKLGDTYAFPPDEMHRGELGWLVALGDTPTEVLERIKALADLLPDGLNADVEALAGVIQEIEEGEKQGIPFTDEPVPEPAIVL